MLANPKAGISMTVMQVHCGEAMGARPAKM
jgi:hypothetical protein